MNADTVLLVRQQDVIDKAIAVCAQHDRLRACINEFEPEDTSACAEHRDNLDIAIEMLDQALIKLAEVVS